MKTDNGMMKWIRHIRGIRLLGTRMIMLGFVGLIVLGTILLLLPISTRAGEETTVLGALFTAVSSTCVTGLVVYDTWMHWTLFGQIVLLLLIQIGGLGFITIGSFAMMMLGRRIGLRGRELIHESLNTLQLQGTVRLVRRIICGTAVMEGAGAVLLSIRFVPRYGLARGIWYGIFHAVSAFCNAGFDLLGCEEPFGSFSAYATDPLVCLTLMALIVIGGIGFLVWEDVWVHRFSISRYRLQSKVVLATSAVLIVVGAVIFWICEHGRLFSDMTFGGQVLSSLFCAVTPRTAGFNTVDTAALSSGSRVLTMVLMFIGGSPGSTAGGVKTTTILVLFVSVGAYLVRSEDAVVFHKRLDTDAVRRASVVVFINFSLALLAILLLLIGQDLPFDEVLFESFSAIGTVGMSTGLTRDLNALSQVVILLLMFLGRVGSLSFAMSFTERKNVGRIRYPEEKITVG